jgi:hypothetical protein
VIRWSIARGRPTRRRLQNDGSAVYELDCLQSRRPTPTLRKAPPIAPGGALSLDGMAGAETWHRLLNAIERLQAKAPAEGEKVH